MRMTVILQFAVFAAVCTAAEPGSPEAKKLSLHAPGAAAAGELRLLPGEQEIHDGDAFGLYRKVMELLPKDLDWNKIRSWRDVPVRDLPLDEVESVLQPLEASLPLLEQAGRCKRCDWPLAADDDSPIDLTACRNLVFLVALKARSQLARGDYAPCVETLRTGLALARHLNDGPTAIHLLVGVTVGAVIWGEIEQYVQQPGAPSLEAAIRAIPKPLFDENHSDLYGMDADSRNRIRLLVRRANRHLLALRYIETLRVHGARSGQWPDSLDELNVSPPDDPVSGKPFTYKRLTETQAILEGPLPEGGGTKDVVRYELNLVK